MELAFGLVSLPGTIDVCIKWGKALCEACSSFRQADARIEELDLRIQLCWIRVLSQLEVTRELDSTMTDEHRRLQHRVICVLQGKLEVATSRLSELVVRPGPARTMQKLKMALARDTFSEAISELEAWQKLYEPCWFQLIKLAPPTVDMTLNGAIKNGPSATVRSVMVARKFRRAFKDPAEASQSVFVDEGELENYNIAAIPFCTATVASCPGHNKQLIVDVASAGAVERKDARNLAFRLRDADPATFGLLSCKAVVRNTKTSEMSFLFRVPERFTTVSSARQLLLSGRAHDSLSDRLEMARRLTTAVYYVHLYGFVHKNIRPETILSLGTGEDGAALPRNAFLIGYQVVRDAHGRTRPAADLRPQANLYRHPQRWGNGREYFVMQHDIYSLGVCLLEIGLWESFVAYDANGAAWPSQVLLGRLGSPEALQDASALKQQLVKLSRGAALRAKMGNKYSKVVETCLTCLDKDNMDFGDEDEFADEDGVVVGVRYIEKVLGALDQVSI